MTLLASWSTRRSLDYSCTKIRPDLSAETVQRKGEWSTIIAVIASRWVRIDSRASLDWTGDSGERLVRDGAGPLDT